MIQVWVPAFAGMTVGVVIHFSISVRHGFAGGENGYAVSGVVRSEGLRERSLRENAGRVSPAVDASCAHALQRFLPRGRSCRALDRTVSEVFRQGCLAI